MKTIKRQVVCFSCGKSCDCVSDECHGCGKIVCVQCADDYGHFGNGEHGKMKGSTVLLVNKIKEQDWLIEQLGEALLVVSKAVEEFVGVKPKIIKGGAIDNFNKWKNKNIED